MGHQDAVGLIEQGRGTHFDPTVFDIFTQVSDEFIDIAERFNDCEAHIIINRQEQQE
jgi:putative two-component system response regulator